MPSKAIANFLRFGFNNLVPKSPRLLAALIHLNGVESKQRFVVPRSPCADCLRSILSVFRHHPTWSKRGFEGQATEICARQAGRANDPAYGHFVLSFERLPVALRDPYPPRKI